MKTFKEIRLDESQLKLKSFYRELNTMIKLGLLNLIEREVQKVIGQKLGSTYTKQKVEKRSSIRLLRNIKN